MKRPKKRHLRRRPKMSFHSYMDLLPIFHPIIWTQYKKKILERRRPLRRKMARSLGESVQGSNHLNQKTKQSLPKRCQSKDPSDHNPNMPASMIPKGQLGKAERKLLVLARNQRPRMIWKEEKWIGFLQRIRQEMEKLILMRNLGTNE